MEKDKEEKINLFILVWDYICDPYPNSNSYFCEWIKRQELWALLYLLKALRYLLKDFRK